jgi:hypothetical protein
LSALELRGDEEMDEGWEYSRDKFEMGQQTLGYALFSAGMGAAKPEVVEEEALAVLLLGAG